MKIETNLRVTLTVDDVKKIVADYLTNKAGYSFKPEDITLHVSPRTVGYGMGEHQEYHLEKCTAEIKVLM